MPGVFPMWTRSYAHYVIMRPRISFLVGVIVTAGLFAAQVHAEEVNSPALTYRPWTKGCLGDECFIGADVVSGCRPRFGAVLIERTGEVKKTLRVTVPPSVDHAHDVRIGIDQDQPVERPVGSCFANFCSAEIEGGAELIARLQRGHKLIFDAVGANGPMHFELPLADFAAAYDGPPQEPKLFEAQSEKLQAELKARANAERIRCGAN